MRSAVVGADPNGREGQLKILQEVITLSVFAGFSVLVMRQKLSWNYFAAFALMLGAVFFIFLDKLGK